MKRIIIAILCFMALQTKAQVIDTTVVGITACKVEPFKAKFSDTLNVTHVGVKIISDDLKSSCQLYFCLMDSTRTIVMQGNRTISGVAYTNWNGNNLYPFIYLGNLLNLVYKLPD